MLSLLHAVCLKVSDFFFCIFLSANSNCAAFEMFCWPGLAYGWRFSTQICFPNATTCPFVDFVVLPPGHGRSVTDFWGWDAHEAQSRCPDGVWVVIEEDVVPGWALNLNSTNLPRPWSPRGSSTSREIPTVEPGIETGASWLVASDSDH